MLFNSYIFLLVFLPCIFALWWALARLPYARLSLLVAGSYVFYGWWDWRFTALLAFSTLVDYWAGHGIAASSRAVSRWFYLLISLTSNLGLLAFFKYSGFMAESVNALTQWLQTGGALPILDVVLPVGISFYTFQTLSYTIDVYRGVIRPSPSLVHFAAYVSMFPQLVAGPIVRYSDVETQFANLPTRLDWNAMQRGIFFFVMGMTQKVLVADSVAKIVNGVFEHGTPTDFAHAWLALLSYSCQLYFDFAGYSNMAVGLGCFLGFQFPQNFDSPYQAVSIQDFWRRWHMTLSSFLRDYLYIPLGGNRQGKLRSMRNLLVVMTLGGIWHGAGWTFLLWGVYHGALLVAHQMWKSAVPFKLPKPIAVMLTFLCVILGWVLFRAPTVTSAGAWYVALFTPSMVFPETFLVSKALCGVLGLTLAAVFFLPNLWRVRVPNHLFAAVALSLLLVVCILRLDAESPFLYFQF